jgi:GNAT superfamily N-acetyltransferase
MPPDTARNCDVKFLRGNDFLAMSSGKIPAVILNRVIGLGIKKEITPDELKKILGFFNHHLFPFSISLSPFAKPENLKETLIKNNISTKNSWNKFYRNCEPVPEHETSLRIEEINSKHADNFAEIVINVFKNPPELKPNVSLLVGRKNWHHYLAFHNELPVAAGSMYVHGDTAWFGMATTLAEYRGKGAQSAIIAKRINKASELGCKWISVETDVHSDEKPNPSYLNMLKYGFNFIYKRPNFVSGKKD